MKNTHRIKEWTTPILKTISTMETKESVLVDTSGNPYLKKNTDDTSGLGGKT